MEKSGGVFGEEGECGDDDVEELLVTERRSLDILSVKQDYLREHWLKCR